ncbi:MAG: acyl-CoA synthetase [Hyphomicrobiales bacterium]
MPLPPTSNLGYALSLTAQRLPEHIGLAWGERSWTWAEINSRVNAAVSSLRKKGVGKGDRVLVHSRNSNVMFETMWVAFKLGAAWVPTNFRLSPGEVAYLSEASRAKVMIYGAEFDDYPPAAREADPHLAHVFSDAEYEGLVDTDASLVPAASGRMEEDVAYDDPLWFFFTSGTTGRPKGALLTHGQMAYCITNQIADLMPGLNESDASLALAPLSHGAGLHAIPQVVRGAKTIIPEARGMDVEELFRLSEKHRITNMFTVPTIVKAMTEHPAVDEYDHSSLKQVIYAGAPMYRADQVHALNKLGPCLVQYFGLGEVTGNISYLPADMHSTDDAVHPIGSCGFARTGMEIAILDEDCNQLAPGEKGEICVRGPGVFDGYFENDEANEKVFRGGWLHTGDLGTMDERGLLYITGRASDMFISGGSNIYPKEIEEIFLTHPEIAEVCVLGVEDDKWGEIGVAVVVRAPESALDGEQALKFAYGKLAKYKWPRRFVFWDDIPKSGYGKVPKKLVREELRKREGF